MTSLVVVSAGLSNPSSTRLLADSLTSATVHALGDVGAQLEVTRIELRELAHQLTDYLLAGFPGPQLAEAIEAVRRADGVIAVTPVFSASYSGLFKTFFDVLEEGVLAGKPVLVAATAGTARHSLVLEHALRPLFSYLHAIVVPTGVFAATDDFGAGELDHRIARAAGELAAVMGAAVMGTAVMGTVQPVGRAATTRRTVEDEFAKPTPFDQLLREASGASRMGAGGSI